MKRLPHSVLLISLMMNSILQTAEQKTLKQLSPDQDLLKKVQEAVHYNKDHEKAITALIKSKADVNISDSKTKHTLLHLATLPDLHGLSLATARLLLDHKAQVNKPDSKGNTPLHHAAAGNNADFVKLLLEYNADPTIKNKVNSIPLHHAYDNEIRKLLHKAQLGDA